MIDHINVFQPIHPLDSTAGASGSSNAGPTTTPNDTLDANSFITLLTTELQAQDPTNPLDPTALVSQLTDMNSLQELIQIRADLDSLVSAATTAASGTPSGQTAGAASPNAPNANALGTRPAGSVTNANSTLAAAAALKTQAAATLQNSLSALPGLLGHSSPGPPGSAASHYARSRSLSHIF